MSSSKSPKKKMCQTVSFVKCTNPEITKIEPRPGGLVPIISVSHKPSVKITEPAATSTPMPSSQQLHIEEKISKEFRVQTALDETESVEEFACTVPDPLRDAMFMFGVTVSGLVMMASGHATMPDEYPQWIKKCLESIKDDFGNHPPNVQRLLNHLKHLESTGKLKPAETEETTDDPNVEGGAGAKRPSQDTITAEPVEGDEDVTVKTTTRLRMGSKDEA